MAAYGAVYEVPLGRIIGTFTATSEELLLVQAIPAGHAMLQMESALPGDTIPFYYVSGEALQLSTLHTIVASGSPFPPDGVTPCTVTLAPFVPCTLLVDSSMAYLTTEDPVLTITSAVEHRFFIALEWMPGVVAYPIAVIAGDFAIQVSETVRMTDTSTLFRAMGSILVTQTIRIGSLPILWFRNLLQATAVTVTTTETTTVRLTNLIAPIAAVVAVSDIPTVEEA